MKKNKLVIFLLLLVVSLFLQLNWKAVFGWSPEFVLALLVVAVFYLDILETAALLAVSAFLLGWRPSPGWEIYFFLFLPLAVMAARKILPWRSWFSCVFGAAASAAVFYLASNWQAVAAEPVIFALIIAMTAAFSAAVFQLVYYFHSVRPA